MKWLDSRSGAGFVQHELRTAFHPKKKGRGETVRVADVQRFSDQGRWTGSTNTLWTLVGKADFQASPKTY